jgi:(1->4)-alpha-D-glucan 1-alpha-D-glucosylmutase
VAVPRSTYRLQITESFDLFAAAELCAYLAALGVDGVYLSPLLPSVRGSQHGYDVVGYDRIDPARGGRKGWEHFLAAARTHDLKVIVDIVPNHTGVADAAQNPAWWDLLWLGPASSYAAWFDIDWSDGRVRVPVLGDDFDPSQLVIVDGELRYFEHRYPLAPGSADDGADATTVHGRQHYELINFRRADTEQNYRRFFAVTDLAGLRVEDEAVLDATHVEIARWLREDGIDGLRVDHPDGLADPLGYLQRLRALAGPDAWLLVEKILEPGETLPTEWPVDGTTGYEVLNEINRQMLDPGLGTFGQLQRELGDSTTYPECITDSKRQVATGILRAELLRMARLAPDLPDAVDALTELVVAFPVYRSYQPVGDEHLTAALTTARSIRPELAETFDRLLPRLRDPSDELCLRFQQSTGAVMAKGVEDTAFYRYNRFIALNEVGGDLDPGWPPFEQTFYYKQRQRHRDLPHSMTTLSTHDTKRGEDVRARLHALNDFDLEWGPLITQLAAEVPIADPSLANLLWQTLVGAGFIERSRMHAYIEKAMREASVSTSWIDPNVAFEASVHAAIDRAYDDPAVHEPLAEFIDQITPYGWHISLAQKLVQLTLPGVPDVYQGTELWEDSLVDPDNRRPVDFGARRTMLAMLDEMGEPPGVEDFGLAKLWITSRTLRLRRDRPELFGGFDLVRLDIDFERYPRGEVAAESNLIAFDRGGAITIATRGPAQLDEVGGWADLSLDVPGAYVDVLTGTHHMWPIRMADLLSWYPVALLVPES